MLIKKYRKDFFKKENLHFLNILTGHRMIVLVLENVLYTFVAKDERTSIRARRKCFQLYKAYIAKVNGAFSLQNACKTFLYSSPACQVPLKNWLDKKKESLS